jgi:conjugative transfer signal peptidase TraF
MPEGWYWLLPIKHYERGEVVVFKPSQAVLQYLESHHWLASNRILMKKLYGLPGDEVCIRDSAVWVNGQKTVNVIADYAPGKALPQLQFCRQLQPSEYFLIGDRVANSFDSRYFGPVPQKAIIARAVPI